MSSTITQFNPSMSRSRYRWTIHADKRIHIDDLCDLPGQVQMRSAFIKDAMSVTNNAENVLKEINSVYPIAGLTITYQDTMGQIDELAHDGSEFTGFIPGRGKWG
jgi:hypothetical protein